MVSSFSSSPLHRNSASLISLSSHVSHLSTRPCVPEPQTCPSHIHPPSSTAHDTHVTRLVADDARSNGTAQGDQRGPQPRGVRHVTCAIDAGHFSSTRYRNSFRRNVDDPVQTPRGGRHGEIRHGGTAGKMHAHPASDATRSSTRCTPCARSRGW